MTREDIYIRAFAQPRMLQALRGMVRGYVAALGFPPDMTEEIVLAVDEACTNIIRHAYRGRKNARFDLTGRSSRSYVEFVLHDEGRPPAPVRIAPRQCSRTSVRAGGFGLEIMRRVFDEVLFQPGKDGGNCVILRLERPQVRPRKSHIVGRKE